MCQGLNSSWASWWFTFDMSIQVGAFFARSASTILKSNPDPIGPISRIKSNQWLCSILNQHQCSSSPVLCLAGSLHCCPNSLWLLSRCQLQPAMRSMTYSAIFCSTSELTGFSWSRCFGLLNWLVICNCHYGVVLGQTWSLINVLWWWSITKG